MPTQQTKPMVSEVSICNQALQSLGQTPIDSLNDASKAAEWMNGNYPFLRDAVIEERMWSFAAVRYTSVSEDVTDWGGQFEHIAPLDWLSVFRCYSSVRGQPSNWVPAEGWVREGDFVLASQSTLYMWGVQRITNTAKFTPMFVQTLAGRLAAEACIPLTENVKLQRDLWTLYGDKLKVAASRDGQQGGVEHVTQTRLNNARFGGLGY